MLTQIEATARILSEKPSGVTVDGRGFIPSSGYVVSIAGYNNQLLTSLESFYFERAVKHWVKWANIRRPKGSYFGIWTAPAGVIHLDINLIFPSRAHALTFAATQGQQSIYHLDTQETIEI